MAGIQKCAKNVLFIARHSKDLDQAKKRIEQLSSKLKRNIAGVSPSRNRFEISLDRLITTWTPSGSWTSSRVAGSRTLAATCARGLIAAAGLNDQQRKEGRPGGPANVGMARKLPEQTIVRNYFTN